MSLKMFHLVFITLSVVLCAAFGAWATAQYRASPSSGELAAAAGAFVASALLVAYGRAFLRKTRGIGLMALALWLLAPADALACPVCFGISDSPVARGMSMAVVVLLVITTGVLTLFATFFVYLIRRARLRGAADPTADAAVMPGTIVNPQSTLS
jgi:hypothetical protein